MDHSPGFHRLVEESRRRVRETTPEAVHARQRAGERFHLIDVREDGEWAQGRARGAVHVGKGVIERDIERLFPDPDADIVLYCGGGYRSALAADALQRMGYRRVQSMDGGWRRWQELGLPTEA
jgi:rhodanese-related sulfurtransferase